MDISKQLVDTCPSCTGRENINAQQVDSSQCGFSCVDDFIAPCTGY